ncbi:hypothetical protein CIB93_01620 [Streptomyces sp. WZ.A104]|uniref:Integral membrane protein n=1 Tax=Streptomyces durocortorensis TaxID=2811104 RepID=A0ABY9VSJ1_9ACTN|nr:MULTISPECIES: hypothetical protein [Streptomyces]PCG87766.1 hypothetical protein CIB93_01620 [Streptomyces sp. WZ.A104]WNF26906.1 hypothetical protein RI138_08690 [Streptomyces durocortorensis]
MRSPARLVTGTVGAAFTVIALGLTTAAPSAYAGDVGRLEITPSTATPGATVTVNTTLCGPKGGDGDASDLNAEDFRVRPGTHKEDSVGQFTVPHDTRPGTYEVFVFCHNGKDAAGSLKVIGGGRHEKPSGHVRTGVGGSVEPDSTQVALGVGVIGLAAVGGLWLLRRRSEGTEGS